MKNLSNNTTKFSPPKAEDAAGRGGLKKLLLITTFSFFLCTLSYSQEYTWHDISANIPQTGETPPDLSDVYFVSDNEGWISSSSHAEIYHTTDGGATFEVQTTQYHCNAIHMLNANEGYAGGASGRVYRTTDGGDNWIAIGSIGVTLADISFPPSGETGYACGLNGNIWSIDSTGVTKMTSNINGSLDAISFPVNSEEGWVCGGSVIRHFFNDVWIADQFKPSGGYYAIFMVDTLNGWAAGGNGIIIHTEDGHNWYTQQTNPAYILTDVFFMNTLEGWVVGSGGGIFHTTNSGTNWNIEGEGLSSSILGGVHFTSPTNGYVVGNDKTLLKYGEVSAIGDEVERMKFEIYPNPAVDEFGVSSSEFGVESCTIELFDLNGKKLLEKHIPARPAGGPAGTETVEIDVSRLKSGVYFCRVSSEKYSVTKKLIIQK